MMVRCISRMRVQDMVEGRETCVLNSAGCTGIRGRELGIGTTKGYGTEELAREREQEG